MTNDTGKLHSLYPYWGSDITIICDGKSIKSLMLEICLYLLHMDYRILKMFCWCWILQRICFLLENLLIIYFVSPFSHPMALWLEMRKHRRDCLMVMEKVVFACGRKHMLCSLQMKALEKIWHQQSGNPIQKLFTILSKNPFVEVRWLKLVNFHILLTRHIVIFHYIRYIVIYGAWHQLLLSKFFDTMCPLSTHGCIL